MVAITVGGDNMHSASSEVLGGITFTCRTTEYHERGSDNSRWR